MIKILLIGSGAREHALGWSLKRNTEVSLYVWGSSKNPGLFRLAQEYRIGSMEDIAGMVAWARDRGIDWAMVGPEMPLSLGIVDALGVVGISSVGPTRLAAQLETSKSFARQLLVDAGIPFYPRFRSCSGKEELGRWIKSLGIEFVVKPDGLTGGKGVKVQGDHFMKPEEGIQYAEECLEHDGRVVIEEKLIGQEFSLMSFTDGVHLLHMPAVQDNKRLLEGDEGPNTGGMGSVSDAGHSLPFLASSDIHAAQETNERAIKALRQKGIEYRGIIYGNYIAVKDGIKLIEFNARFGDPEAMNIMCTLDSDLVEICQGIINGNLNAVRPKFENKATVCKYVVPEGYPEHPVKNVKIDVSVVNQKNAKLFYASVDERSKNLYLTGSRAIGIVGIADTLPEAEQRAETEIKKIKGPVVHRRDIGTKELTEKRVEMMRTLRI